MSFHVPEKFRVKSGPMATDASAGSNGLFIVKRVHKNGRALVCVASDGEGWEHVSVSLGDRVPNWEEMSHIKGLFWGEEDLVIQIHPPKVDYVNRCATCLHLWRKSGTNDYCERPPKWMV